MCKKGRVSGFGANQKNKPQEKPPRTVYFLQSRTGLLIRYLHKTQPTCTLHANNDTAQPGAAVVIDINILLPNTTMVKFRTAGCLLALSALSTARYYHGTTSAVGPAAINHTTMRILV